jgi:hypothetical protein
VQYSGYVLYLYSLNLFASGQLWAAPLATHPRTCSSLYRVIWILDVLTLLLGREGGGGGSIK